MSELDQFDIPQKVKGKYFLFGLILMGEGYLWQLFNLEREYGDDVEKITHEILCHWLGGHGTSMTWENLVFTLRKCELSSVADEIEKARKYLLCFVFWCLRQCM